jgi:hypothetical protein
LHALPLPQFVQAFPPVPHAVASVVPLTHMPFDAQQPLQVVGSHLGTHAPPLQLADPPQSLHTWPPAPQAESLVPPRQTPDELQQPGRHELGLQLGGSTQAPSEQTWLPAHA